MTTRRTAKRQAVQPADKPQPRALFRLKKGASWPPEVPAVVEFTPEARRFVDARNEELAGSDEKHAGCVESMQAVTLINMYRHNGPSPQWIEGDSIELSLEVLDELLRYAETGLRTAQSRMRGTADRRLELFRFVLANPSIQTLDDVTRRHDAPVWVTDSGPDAISERVKERIVKAARWSAPKPGRKPRRPK